MRLMSVLYSQQQAPNGACCVLRYNRVMKVSFTPKIEMFKDIKSAVAPMMNELRLEPSFIYAKPEIIRKYGGKIANLILDHIPLDRFKYPVIDVRNSFVSPNNHQVPLAWHCDTSPITMVCSLSSSDGLGHFVNLCNGEFIKDPYICSDDEVDSPYEGFSKEAENTQKNNRFLDVGDGKIILFNHDTLHTATAAVASGQRLFFRITDREHEYERDHGSSGWYYDSRFSRRIEGERFVSVNLEKEIVIHGGREYHVGKDVFASFLNFRYGLSLSEEKFLDFIHRLDLKYLGMGLEALSVYDWRTYYKLNNLP